MANSEIQHLIFGNYFHQDLKNRTLMQLEIQENALPTHFPSLF